MARSEDAELDAVCSALMAAEPSDVFLVRVARRAHQQRLQALLLSKLQTLQPTLHLVSLDFEVLNAALADVMRTAIAQQAPDVLLIAGLIEPDGDSKETSARFQQSANALFDWPTSGAGRLILWLQEATISQLAELQPSAFEARARVYSFDEPDPALQDLLDGRTKRDPATPEQWLPRVWEYADRPAFERDQQRESRLLWQLMQEHTSPPKRQRDLRRWRVMWLRAELHREIRSLSVLTSLARAVARADNNDVALRLFEQIAHAAAERDDTPALISAELGQADVQLRRGNLPAAFDQYRFALKLARLHVEPRFVSPAALGLRTCVERQQTAGGSCAALVVPPLRSPYEQPLRLAKPPSQPAAQALLDAVLQLEWDFDSFCLGYFATFILHTSLESERSERTLQLLQHMGIESVVVALAHAEPARFRQWRHLIE